MGAFLAGADPAWFVQGGAVAILGGVFWAIVRGGLVPGRTVDRMARQWEAQVQAAERREESWRQAHKVAAMQVDQLLVVGRVAEAMALALPAATPDPD